jgi:hypothetical protein
MVREQLNGIERPSAGELWDRTIATRLRYLAWAGENGFGEVTRTERFGEPRIWLTDSGSVERPPSEINLTEAVLAELGAGSVRKTVYRFTSSSLHTRAHAFTLFQPAPGQSQQIVRSSPRATNSCCGGVPIVRGYVL